MGSSNLPTISVLMSVYNGEKWLPESVSSILNQTYLDFEFIIINDGSTDNSLSLLKKFALLDSRIKIFSKKNSGLAESLNYGISKSRGKWIARIDADDIASSQRLSKQLELAEKDPNLVLVGSGLTIIDDNFNRGGIYQYPKRHNNLLRRIALGLPFFPHSSAFFRADAAIEIGGYRKRLLRAQDQDLWLRLSEKGKITSIREPLIFLRKHNQQISSSESGKTQFIYSYLAMVCFFLRQTGKNDPIQTNSDNDFQKFFDFIYKKMDENSLFDFQNKLAKIKLEISEENNFFAKIILLLRTFIFDLPLAMYFFKSRLLGAILVKNLAREWCKFHSNNNTMGKN